ncbi:MAG: TetR/AcrR family transcriptional regulator [Lachnospiraceae bacterium]
MPPKCRFTREEIIQAALDLTAEKGVGALTARGLAQRLGSSAKPIFGLFANMEEVQQEVVKAANLRYQEYLRQDMSAGRYPPYKASGMAYIRFAREQKELFKLLFMRDRTHEEKAAGDELEALLGLIQKNMGLSRDDAYRFHLEMWIYVHGIATMIATAYLEWDMDFISAALTDAYQGLRLRFLPKETEGERK